MMSYNVYTLENGVWTDGGYRLGWVSACEVARTLKFYPEFYAMVLVVAL